jgi:hypothetical protein
MREAMGCAEGSCVCLRLAHHHHVWWYDFVADRTQNDRPFRILSIPLILADLFLIAGSRRISVWITAMILSPECSDHE